MTNSRTDGNGPAPTEQDAISNKMLTIIRISRTSSLKWLKKEAEKELLDGWDLSSSQSRKIIARIEAIEAELERRAKRDKEAEE